MRRTILLLASTALVVLLASGVALAATNEFSNPTRITVPDRGAATPYPSAIPVSGLGTVTDVDLKLNGFSHTYPVGAEVELMSPSGTRVKVMSDVGGSYDVSNIDLTLDDEATSGLPLYSQLSSGSFRPSSSLSAFDGTNPNGVWELYVDNTECCGQASFAGGWSLTITSEGAAEPLPPDTTPPDTRLLEPTPSALSRDASPKFSFRSSETNSTFECKMDGNSFQPCTAPKQYFLLSDGQHTLQVRGKDASGNTDQTPAQHTWIVDSHGPKMTFSQHAGNVTNDRSPTWAWTVEDSNFDPNFDRVSCDIDENISPYRQLVTIDPCSSPYTFEGELPDGYYSFEVEGYDKAGNYGYAYKRFEVDTVAPKIVSTAPTGKLVQTSADVVIAFDDDVYGSTKFVNIYKRGSSTPLAVYRYGETWHEKKIEISPKSYLKRDTWYTVKVTTGVNDGANNLEAPKTWNFKTK